MGDWALGATPSLASDGGNWYDPVVADLESNPEAAVQKYGELAKGLPDYAAGRIQQAAIAGATAAGTAACLAAGLALAVPLQGIKTLGFRARQPTHEPV